MMKKYHILLLLSLACLPAVFAQEFIRVEAAAQLDHIRVNNGLSVADYDQDGDLDIFLVGYYSFLSYDSTTWNRLLRNNGDGTFADVTMDAGFDRQFVNLAERASLGEKMGASWGDYDNDGYPDLFLTNSRYDQLYHNEGDGTFKDVTLGSGTEGCYACYSSSAMWWDPDRDGDLDLFVSRLNEPNTMYINEGDGTFRNATEQMGLPTIGTLVTWTSISLDVNGDGYLDLLTINDTYANQLYINRSGNSFIESTLAYRLDDDGAGMGVTIGDYNNDLKLDIYITQIFNYKPNPLFENTGQLRFVDVAAETGVENSGWGWGTHFFDYDHDGDEDIYAVNGVVSKQTIDGKEQEDEPNYFYKNTLIEGKKGFIDWSGPSGTDAMDRARGMEVFDYDQDGDLDMLVANVETSPFLYQNQTMEQAIPDRNWLQVDLEGSISNRDAYGTTLLARSGEQAWMRYHHGVAFMGQSQRPVHFGLGAVAQIDELLITWPSGNRDTLYDVAANQILQIKETPRDPGNALDAPVLSYGTKGYAYPNPFSEATTFHFECPRAGTLRVRFFSDKGQELYQYEKTVAGASVIEFPWGNADSDRPVIAHRIYYYVAEFTNQFESLHFQGKIIKQ